jgi:hypothetical protein
MEQTTTEDILNLGARLGRKQAFGLVARRCSAAEIECLIEARENKLYLAVEPTWEAYCQNRAGISRATADRLIHQYQEQGPSLARLNSYTRIRPSEYRLLAAALTDEGLTHNGEVIPLELENAPQLTRAVDAIRGASVAETPPPDPAEQAFAKAAKALETAFAEFTRLHTMNLDDENRLRLAIALEAGRDQLDTLRISTGL